MTSFLDAIAGAASYNHNEVLNLELVEGHKLVLKVPPSWQRIGNMTGRPKRDSVSVTICAFEDLALSAFVAGPLQNTIIVTCYSYAAEVSPALEAWHGTNRE